MCLCFWIVFVKVVSNLCSAPARPCRHRPSQSRAIFEVGGVHRPWLHCTTVPPASLAGRQLNAQLASWRRVPSFLPPTLFVSDKMAEVSGPGEPMEVEEEERSTMEAGGGDKSSADSKAAEPSLLLPPPPPPNPAQNPPHPQLSITQVRRTS